MEYISWGFDTLPKEIKQLIFSFTDLDLLTVLRAQSVSTEFKKLCWAWLRTFDAVIPNQKQRTRVIEKFIDQATPSLIERILFSQWENPVASALAMIEKYPNLERINFNYLLESEGYNNIRDNLAKLKQHHKLKEIGFGGGYWNREQFGFTQLTNEWASLAKITLDKAYHRGGTIGAKMVVIGATDGTLTFLTLEEQFRESTLQIHLVNNTHKGCINAIWCEPPISYSGKTYTCIASSDGIVTCWSYMDEEPVLNHTLSFPESILFVSEYASNYILAAGKRTLYVTDIDSGNIMQQIEVDDDITGLFSLDQKSALSTTNGLYTLEQEQLGKDRLQKVADAPYPNIWLSPDVSLRVTVKPTEIEVFSHEPNSPAVRYNIRTVANGEGDIKFDTRPHLSRFNPVRYWLTTSTGSRLITYDLASHCCFAQLSPDSTETGSELPPQCNSFWYSSCGNILFGLFSDNTLHWWFLYLNHRSTE